jgi:hypothetical protein
VVVDPPASFSNPVWVDGQWTWQGRRWLWEPGQWVDLEPGVAYAAPSLFRRGDGQLVWFRGKLRAGVGGSAEGTKAEAAAP